MPTANIKIFHSAMAGAPVLTGQVGKLIDVLDACLVNGFGTGTVDSVVIASGIATVTRAAGHPFEVDAFALIAGATVTGGSINGEKRVLSSTSTTYTFDATGIPNQTATGTITHKLAPLEFTKTYSGTNLAAYKSSEVTSSGCLLRVDDTVSNTSRVVGYATMSDINTGTLPFPTAALVSGGAWWAKSQTSDAVVRAWTLVGDSRGFYLHIVYGVGTCTTGFGDFKSTKSPDAYACMLGGGTATYSSNAPAGTADFAHTQSSTGGLWAPRGASGLGSAVAFTRMAYAPIGLPSAGYYSGATSTQYMLFPNPADNGVYLSPMTLAESVSGSVYRGDIPGLYYVPQAIGTAIFAHRERLESVSGLSGRKLMALLNGNGVMFVDITGPWAR